MADLDHIEITKEDLVRRYKFRPFPNASRPIDRDRIAHGSKLAEELSRAAESVVSKRAHLGIDSRKLLVLEVVSDSMSLEVLENMLLKFRENPMQGQAAAGFIGFSGFEIGDLVEVDGQQVHVYDIRLVQEFRTRRSYCEVRTTTPIGAYGPWIPAERVKLIGQSSIEKCPLCDGHGVARVKEDK